MSATKPTIQARPVCWLCDMEIGFYSDKTESQGKIVHHSCLKRRGYKLDTISYLSGPRKVEPKALAQETFSTHLFILNLAQLDQLITNIDAIKAKRSEHYHWCFECGCRVECYKGEGCTDTDDQCRPCHEGLSKRQFERLASWV